MESTVRPPAPRARAAARGPAARRPRAGGTVVGGAVLVATAAGGGGGPAAAIAFGDTTLLGRLLAQLADLGIRETQILTRPEWVSALTAAADGHGIAARVRGVDGTAGALRAVAELAGAGDGTLVVANADILTQREALAGLIADPRVPTGMLTTTVRRVYRYVGLRTRTRPGRPQTNGHVERLHKTILDECWRPSFARYLHIKYHGLRRDLADYITYYNTDRAHNGRITKGRIPADIIDPAHKIRPRT